MGKTLTIGAAVGRLDTFIIEPFVPHEQSEEYYVCIYATREGNTILFHHEGGVDVGDIDAKANRLDISIDGVLSVDKAKELVGELPAEQRK